MPIPLYQDAVAAEMRFVMEDAEIAFAFAENQEQAGQAAGSARKRSGIRSHHL